MYVQLACKAVHVTFVLLLRNIDSYLIVTMSCNASRRQLKHCATCMISYKPMFLYGYVYVSRGL